MRVRVLAAVSTGPDDGPNQPMGKAIGIHPGRVDWAWDSKATDENCQGYYYNPELQDSRNNSLILRSSKQLR